MSVDLIREWRDCCRWPDAQETANLHRLGISSDMAARSPSGGIQIGMIETGARYFNFAPAGAGRKAVIMVCDLVAAESGADITDLLAFNPRKPSSWWLRLDMTDWLGGWEIDRRSVSGLGGALYLAPTGEPCSYTEEPIPIWRNPLSWLAAGCVGAVPLTATAKQDIRFLDCPVIAEDIAHGEEIQEALRQPYRPIPPILIREHRRAA